MSNIPKMGHLTTPGKPMKYQLDWGHKMKYHFALGLNHLHMADFPLSGRSTIWQAVNHFLIPYQACAWGTPMGFYRYSDINTSIGFRCAPQFASFIFETQLLLRVSSLNRQRAFCLKSPAEEAQCKSSFGYWQYLDEDPVIQDIYIYIYNSRTLFLYCLSMMFYIQRKMMFKVFRKFGVRHHLRYRLLCVRDVGIVNLPSCQSQNSTIVTYERLPWFRINPYNMSP